MNPSDLLRSGIVDIMGFGEGDDQAAMMMEPVGGMDGVVKGFLRKVGHLVQLHCVVQKIELMPQGVRIDYLDKGKDKSLTADYVLNCIPSHILAGLTHNFPKEYAAGLAAIPRGKLFKIGHQCSERFWEKEYIYGGISWTTQDLTQMWYPAHGINGKKGVILGTYTFADELGDKWSGMPHPAAHRGLDPAGREAASGLPQIRGEQRFHSLAEHAAHAGLRGGLDGRAARAALQDVAGPGRQPLHDRRPDQLFAGLADRCHAFGIPCDRGHRPPRARTRRDEARQLSWRRPINNEDVQ